MLTLCYCIYSTKQQCPSVYVKIYRYVYIHYYTYTGGVLKLLHQFEQHTIVNIVNIVNNEQSPILRKYHLRRNAYLNQAFAYGYG